MEKNTMINGIVKRYIAHNQEDFEHGWIDFNTLRACNDAACGFTNTLDRLTDSELTTFYRLEKKVQNKVFDWDSAYNSAFFSQSAVTALITILEKDLVKSGLNKIPVVYKIASMYLKNLYRYDSANFEDLGNGIAVYHFN